MKQTLLLLLAIVLVATGCAKEEPATDTGTTASAETAGANDTMASMTGTGATGGTVSTLTADERAFVVSTAQGGIAEVSLGQMASTKAANAEVTAFASRMVTDHSKANAELTQFANTKGIAVPSETDDDHKKKADDLSKLSGTAFDKAYIAAMVEDHQKTVSAFERLSQSGGDPDLKTWVTNTLPALRDHLTMAQDLSAKVK
jgi:putative membrane protein